MSEGLTSESSGAAPLSSLRQAREAAGLHIAALAAALKVPVKKLEALEAGRYEELPDLTFARALASSACRQLKVDPAAVLQQIPLAHGPQLGDVPPSINAPFKGAVPAPAFNPAAWLARPPVLAALGLLLAALVVWFMPAREATQPEAVMPPEPAPVAATQVDDAPSDGVVTPTEAAVANAAVSTDAGAPGVQVAADASSPSVSTPTATGVVATATAAASGSATVAAPDASVVLRIAVSGDSWVEVVNGQGGTSVQRMLKAGDVLDFSTKPPYAVVIGRADVAQVSVRGQPLDITQFARNSVARFEVK